MKKPATAPPATVDDYLDHVPDPARTTLTKIRATIRSVVPPETTECISYKIPAFKYKGMLVWYAAFSDHCSLFPGAAVLKKFESELARYSISKGTVRFPVDKPLPSPLLKKLIRAKIAENESKKRR